MVISRVIIKVTTFRALVTLLITYLLSPLPLQASRVWAVGLESVRLGSLASGWGFWGFGCGSKVESRVKGLGVEV